jgi:hypothetical protein
MTGPWSCSGCTNTWGGLKAEHCPECHHTFTGTAAGDKHRTRDFRCLPPDAAGLVQRDNGVWGLPITPEARERLANLGRRKEAS